MIDLRQQKNHNRKWIPCSFYKCCNAERHQFGFYWTDFYLSFIKTLLNFNIKHQQKQKCFLWLPEGIDIVPVLRLCLIISACRGCECTLAMYSGVGHFSIPVELFTSAPQKISLKVSSKSLLCTFMQRACRWQGTEKKQTTLENVFHGIECW